VRAALAAICAVAVASCAGPRNYVDPGGPRYSGCFSSDAPGADLRVVTFNIKFAEKVEDAIALMKETPELRGADVVMLQEMDFAGVHQIAFALGMCYVFYPATVHPSSGRDFGNAILSRWPIEDDRKIILPHNGRFGKTQRIAVAGTIVAHGRRLRLYTFHLATWIEVSFGNRKDQARAIVADAEQGYDLVLAAGDLNSHDVGEIFAERGFAWPTRGLPHTAKGGSIDHIFLRGVSLKDSTSVGEVQDNRGASDHKPVWAVIGL